MWERGTGERRAGVHEHDRDQLSTIIAIYYLTDFAPSADRGRLATGARGPGRASTLRTTSVRKITKQHVVSVLRGAHVSAQLLRRRAQRT